MPHNIMVSIVIWVYKPFYFIQIAAKYIDNFFGNLADVSKNTYYDLSPHWMTRHRDVDKIKDEIRYCLNKWPRLQNKQHNHNTVRSFSNITDILQSVMDEPKHEYGDTNGLYVKLARINVFVCVIKLFKSPER